MRLHDVAIRQGGQLSAEDVDDGGGHTLPVHAQEEVTNSAPQDRQTRLTPRHVRLDALLGRAGLGWKGCCVENGRCHRYLGTECNAYLFTLALDMDFAVFLWNEWMEGWIDGRMDQDGTRLPSPLHKTSGEESVLVDERQKTHVVIAVSISPPDLAGRRWLYDGEI